MRFTAAASARLAITHNPHYREPFEPLPGEVEFVPYGDVEALAAAVDDRWPRWCWSLSRVRTASSCRRPVIWPTPAGSPTEHGALLWIDEVQTGIGRCGEWLVHAADGVVADVVTVAKGLGNGFPVGACVATGPAAELLGARPTAARSAVTRWPVSPDWPC